MTLKMMSQKIKEKIAQLPSEYSYLVDRAKYATQLPKLNQNEFKIVKTLKEQGICITHLDDLQVPSTPEFLEATQLLLPKLVNPTSKNSFFLGASPLETIEHPELFLWGLEEKILKIAESYIGVPVSYLGAAFIRSIPNGENICSRLWHRDTEDRRHLKILVYLNDVDEGSGPFEYLPFSSTPLGLALKYALNSTTFLSEEEYEKLIPKSKIKTCTGRAGTVVLFEPNGFHHGKMPTLKERHAVFFKYSSRKPKHPSYCLPDYNQTEFNFFSNLVSSDKKDYLWQHNIKQR